MTAASSSASAAAPTYTLKPEPSASSVLRICVGAAVLTIAGVTDDCSICAPKTKRSRKHVFDPIADGIYEVESIIAVRTAKGKAEFLIKWK